MRIDAEALRVLEVSRQAAKPQRNWLGVFASWREIRRKGVRFTGKFENSPPQQSVFPFDTEHFNLRFAEHHAGDGQERRDRLDALPAVIGDFEMIGAHGAFPECG